MKRAIWAVIIAVPLVVLLASGFGRDPNAIASPLLNKPAPHFTLQTFDRRPFSLTALHGRPVVLNFWASWCVECRGDHAALVDAWNRYASRGVAFVGVDYQDSVADARSFLRKHGGNGWPNLRDPGERTAIDYGVYGVPETFVIDRQGIVRFKAIGAVSPDVLARQLDSLLRGHR